MPHAYVIGLGKSGIAAAHLLKREGWEVTASDSGISDALLSLCPGLKAAGIAVKLGHSFVPDPETIQRVVVSPGVRWDLPALVNARESGIEVMGEMELGWRSLSSTPWVAITGTNGKTTTTALIAAIFQAAGLNAPACGNIGYAACDVALEFPQAELTANSGKPLDWVVAEVSSYQIESSSTLAPKIGVWTTFTPDHLSRHYTLDNYYDIKATLLKSSEAQIFNGDDPYLRSRADQWAGAYWTSAIGKPGLLSSPQRGAYIEGGWAFALGEAIAPVSSLRMVGSHNHQNLLMAVLAGRLAGIEQAAIAQAIATFPGVPHRLEQIVTWNGIDFINDSKATNYDAADVGLAAVASPAILIAGGDAKAGDDMAWIKRIQAKAAVVLLIGDAAPTFAKRLEQVNYTSYEIVETMDRAVKRGAELAPQHQAKVVLLSPACASFDQYQNFEQRGDHFRQLCLELLT